MMNDSMWPLIQQVVLSLLAVAAVVLAATWSKSPLYLPLPSGPYRRWLRAIPVLATAVILGILRAQFMDCSFLLFLIILPIVALALCIGLMIIHYHLLKRISDISTLLVIICLGWSILGTLSVSATATMLIVKRQMDDIHEKNPLTLWQIVEGHKRKPEDAIYLTAGLPAHFSGEMKECHDTTPEMSISPNIGQLESGTYTAPDSIKKEQLVTLTIKSMYYRDTISTKIILLPDPPEIKRSQYQGEDDKRRKAVFDLIIIAKNDSWVFRSDDLVVKNQPNSTERQHGPLQQTLVCQPILALAGSHAFDPYVDLICIGTASREGTQAEEENRAGRRSVRIAEWINLALRNTRRSKHVYTMNLGQYVPQPGEQKVLTTDEPAPERQVVLIGVVRAGEIDLREALRNVFQQHQENDFFKFLATHYPGREINLYERVSGIACPR